MERPKVGLGVCIIKNDKVLLGKRKNAHGDGSWCFPGGHLEWFESYEEGAQRETFEEVGIAIKNIQFVTATNDLFPEEQKHYVTIYMQAEYDSGETSIKEPDKMMEWAWFSWDKLPQPLFIPMQNLIKQQFNPFAGRK